MRQIKFRLIILFLDARENLCNLLFIGSFIDKITLFIYMLGTPYVSNSSDCRDKVNLQHLNTGLGIVVNSTK